MPVVDLSGGFPNPTPSVLARGGKGTIRLDVINAGNVAARGRLQVTLYASTDSTGAAGVVPLLTTTKSVKIKPGSRQRLRLNFRVPTDLAAGTYFFSAAVDSANAFPEPNEADNLAVSESSFTVT